MHCGRPAWNTEVWGRVAAVGKMMQSSIAGSTQERLECLASEGQNEHLVPANFYVLYPLSVVTWMAILSLGLTKLAHPSHVVYHTVFMVMALRKTRNLRACKSAGEGGAAEQAGHGTVRVRSHGCAQSAPEDKAALV